MKKRCEFNMESLLVGLENPKGPIEQTLFAISMADHLDMETLNRLVRVMFTDKKINAPLSGDAPFDEMLLIGYEIGDYITLHLCLKNERTALKIATAYYPSLEIEMHEEYRRAIVLHKLTAQEIAEIFNYVWEHQDVIRPKPSKE